MSMLIKTAYEEFFRYHQFRRSDGLGWLNSDETLLSASVVVMDSNGADRSAEMVSGAAVYGTDSVIYKLKGGTAGEVYNIGVRAVTSNGQKFEDGLMLKVV